MAGIYEDSMPWANWPWQQCKARLKRGQDPEHFGRCELKKGHYIETADEGDPDHALERGMVWVRWDDEGHIRYETPHYDRET